ncbi:MAG: terminase family protein [Rhodospirillaceae bacterium]
MTVATREVDLGYAPRPQQVELHQALERHRWVIAVCHRRMGKTVCAVNHLIMAALECEKPRPRFAYIAPTYRMAKLIAWDYLKAFTAELPTVEQRESDLIVNFPNGGRVQLFGADNPDSLRGQYFDGVVFDEYGMHQANVFTEVVRPALADRGGWALFLGTPNGRNQFWDVSKQARSGGDDWRYLEFRASQTGLLPESELQAARDVMTEDEFAQEFECSFEAAVRGAIYATELQQARDGGRICTVPYDAALPVDTDWDLGVGDATAIVFTQSLRSGEVRVIDYYEASGEGLPHYAQVLSQRGYVYGKHWAPHDIAVRELGTGKSRLEMAASFGIRFEVTPRLSAGRTEVEDGIHAARLLLGRCWFDQTKAAPLLEALQHYRRDYNTRLQEFKATPVHDWASHGADAFRGLAVRHKTPTEPKAVEPWGVSSNGWSWT